MELKTLDLSIKNFQKITEAKLAFSGLTIVRGDSNLGKSSTRRAVESVVFGGFKNETDNSSGYLKAGTKESTIELSYEGNTVQLTRSKSKNVYVVNGVELPKGGRGVPEQIQDLGYTPLGTNLNLNVAKQHSPLFIIGESDTDITKNINNVFKVQLFEVAVSKILKYRKESETKESVLLEAVERVTKEVEELTTLEALLIKQVEAEEELETIEQYENDVQESRAITSVQEKLVSIQRDMSNISMIDDYLQSMYNVEEIQDTVKILDNLLLDLEQMDLVDEHLYNEIIVKEAKETIDLIKSIQVDLIALEALRDYEDDKSTIEELEEEIEQNRVSLLEVTKELKKHSCKSCGQVIYSGSHNH